MSLLHADLAIIGSGFSGSLLAILAARRGLKVILLDRQTHPRFAIGESSTPIANLLLEKIAEEHDLPWLAPFARYGSWCRRHPTIRRGLKRGFTYKHHVAGRPFTARSDHANELLVESNPDEQHGDTHWLRADFDDYMCRQAAAAGVHVLEGVRVEVERGPAAWRLRAIDNDRSVEIDADFVVDGTGPAAVLPRTLGIENRTNELSTHSRTLYSHFTGVRSWKQLYEDAGGLSSDHPYDCDRSTLHHVFDGGWMWDIPFDHGVTSAGFCLEPGFEPKLESLPLEDQWSALLRRFPSIGEQFAGARAIEPWRHCDRVQYQYRSAAGPDWALLPTTAGFIDPFFSTGNAHTLLGVRRLAQILGTTMPGTERREALRGYSATVLKEIEFIDRLVHLNYLAFGSMAWVSAVSMLYFLAATYQENAMRCGGVDDRFLLSGDADFVRCVNEIHSRLASGLPVRDRPDTEADMLVHEIRRQFARYNVASLCDPSVSNMYRYASPPAATQPAVNTCEIESRH